MENPDLEAAGVGLSGWSSRAGTDHGERGRSRLNRLARPRAMAPGGMMNWKTRPNRDVPVSVKTGVFFAIVLVMQVLITVDW